MTILIPQFDAKGDPAARGDFDLQGDTALLRRQEAALLETVTGARGFVEFPGAPLGLRE